MKQLYYNTAMPIRTLIGQIDSSQIALPDLQRPFVWTDKKVRKLFDSLYRGFPVGTITLWRCASTHKSHFIGLDGHSHAVPNELIIDGQQRLTSLYSVMLGKPVLNSSKKEKRIVISFNPLEEKFEVYYPALKNNPEWIPDISILYTTDKLLQFNTAYLNKLSEYRASQDKPLTDEEQNEITAHLDALRYLENISLQIIEITTDAQEEDVSEMFVRLNSSSTPLRQHDFILTLFSLYWEDGRDKIEDYCTAHIRKSVDDGGKTIGTQSQDIVRTLIAVALDRAQLKYAYKLLHGADFDRKGEIDESLRDARFKMLADKLPAVLDETRWDKFWNIIKSSGYVTAKMIPSHSTVFYTYALYLIAIDRFDGNSPKNKAANESLTALWFFFASLMSIYTDESVMENQLKAIKDLHTFEEYRDYLLSRIDERFTNDYFETTLTGTGELAAYGSGNNAWLAYNAALVVLDTKLLFSKSGNPLRSLLETGYVAGKKMPLEKHHLFPRKYLKDTFSYPDWMVNQMANYAYIDWLDNLIILDTAPASYYAGKSTSGDESNKPEFYILQGVSEEQQMKWESENALPSGWENMPYETFLIERRKLMAQRIREAYEVLRGRI